MREIVITPKREMQPILRHADEPTRGAADALVRTLITGIDGTDEEIVQGRSGEPPPGEDVLVLGHECLGEVLEAPPHSPFEPGDLVVPLVRHGCGTCGACRYGAPDLCPHEDYVEHGIKGLHGFMRDLWTDDPQTLVKAPLQLGRLAVLTEPLSIVVKAVEHARHIQRRIPWFDDEGGFRRQRALLAGTGSLGSLGAFLLRLEGMDVWAMDRHGDETSVAHLLRDIGVEHVNARTEDVGALAEELGGFDLVIEATGVPQVVFQVLPGLASNGVMAMLGVPPEKPAFRVEGDTIMKRMVTRNQTLFGSVNSNRRHFEMAMEALLAARSRWGRTIERVMSDVFLPEEHRQAFDASHPDLIKKFIQWDIPRAAARTSAG